MVNKLRANEVINESKQATGGAASSKVKQVVESTRTRQKAVAKKMSEEALRHLRYATPWRSVFEER